MNLSQIILQKTQEYAKKPAQLSAFIEGVEIGNDAQNSDIATGAEWRAQAKTDAETIVTKARADGDAIKREAHRTLENAQRLARQREDAAQIGIEKRLAELKMMADELEENPRHIAAKKLMADLLEQAGYKNERRSQPIPSNVLCHIATMVAAVAGDNPISISFGNSAKNAD